MKNSILETWEEKINGPATTFENVLLDDCNYMTHFHIDNYDCSLCIVYRDYSLSVYTNHCISWPCI